MLQGFIIRDKSPKPVSATCGPLRWKGHEGEIRLPFMKARIDFDELKRLAKGDGRLQAIHLTPSVQLKQHAQQLLRIVTFKQNKGMYL